jgi:hypothetical protein
MQTRSAVEIARAALRQTFSTATEEGLDNAARQLVRWGLEGHGEGLGTDSAALMYVDLAEVADEERSMIPPRVYAALESSDVRRTWRRPFGPRR